MISLAFVPQSLHFGCSVEYLRHPSLNLDFAYLTAAGVD
jgi:hypothetical protein